MNCCLTQNEYKKKTCKIFCFGKFLNVSQISSLTIVSVKDKVVKKKHLSIIIIDSNPGENTNLLEHKRIRV